MPRANDRGESWVGPSVHHAKGIVMLAIVFIVAVIVVIDLLAVAFGAETRDTFSR